MSEAPHANSPNNALIEPAKIFDNVYVIGNAGTVVYVIQTSDGLLMIDALGAHQLQIQSEEFPESTRGTSLKPAITFAGRFEIRKGVALTRHP